MQVERTYVRTQTPTLIRMTKNDKNATLKKNFEQEVIISFPALKNINYFVFGSSLRFNNIF